MLRFIAGGVVGTLLGCAVSVTALMKYLILNGEVFSDGLTDAMEDALEGYLISKDDVRDVVEVELAKRGL